MAEFLPCFNLTLIVVVFLAIYLYWRRWSRLCGRRWPSGDDPQEKADFTRKVKLPAFYLLAFAVLLMIFLHHVLSPAFLR